MLAGVLSPVVVQAVQVKTGTIPNRGIYGVEIAGTDSQFYARADQVLSVSWQEYTTGAYIVSEVVVDMANSDQQIRIYSLRPPGGDEALATANRAASTSAELRGATAPVPREMPSSLKRLQDRAGNAAGSAVATLPVKSYPATTHAKTVEYVVGSRDELLSFYRSFRDLYTGREVKLDANANATVDGKNNATVFGTPNSGGAQAGQPGLTVSRLGGTLFSIQP